MQTECFEGKDDGGESKRILRSPGITPDGCISAVKSRCEVFRVKKRQEDGAALEDTGGPAVLSYAEPDNTRFRQIHAVKRCMFR